MTSAYKKLSQSQGQSIVKNILDRDNTIPLNINHTEVLSWTLPFALNTQLIECQDYSGMPHVRALYLKKNSDIKPILYSPDPHHDNGLSSLDLSLDNDTILDYLKFYLMMFQTDGGFLIPVTQFDDIEWQDSVSQNILNNIALEIEKYPKVELVKECHRITIICILKQSLFAVAFNISQSGEVSIHDKSLIIRDLPI